MDTEDVIISMLRENTGCHMLDSGGAYGRNFERNRHIDFENSPPLSVIVEDGWADMTILLYHFLCANVEYDAKLTAEFDKYAATRPDDTWLEIMHNFASFKKDYGEPYEANSAGIEHLLSQDIQYVAFERENVTYILLQIHGGCDLRGGYTAPKVFEVLGEDFRLEPTISGYEIDKVDPAQLELPTDMPPRELLYIDYDGYEWTNGHTGGAIPHSDWEYDIENQKIFVRGKEMKFEVNFDW